MDGYLLIATIPMLQMLCQSKSKRKSYDHFKIEVASQNYHTLGIAYVLEVWESLGPHPQTPHPSLYL